VGKRKVIALATLLILLVVGYYVYSTGLLFKWLFTTRIGTWLLAYTPLGIIVRLLYLTPTPPNITPEDWWNWTYQAPVPANQTRRESLAEKLIVESISLVKVADQPKIYSGEPILYTHITGENETVGIYDGRKALIEFANAGKTAGLGLPSAGELAEGRLNVTENLRFRFTYKTTMLNHTIHVSLPSPINPQGGSSPAMILTIAEKSTASKAIFGIYLGKNLYINYLPTEWFSLDVRYVDIWPGFENLIGWRITKEGFGAFCPEIEEFAPKESFVFAMALDSGLYEPAALVKIAIKSSLEQPIIALIVNVGNESVNVPLNFPLKPGDRVSATLGLMQPLKVGEAYEVTIKAYYLNPTGQTVEFLEKSIKVLCKES